MYIMYVCMLYIMYASICVCKYGCTYVYHTYVHICMYVSIGMYICMSYIYVCMYVFTMCIYVSRFVCTYVHNYTDVHA